MRTVFIDSAFRFSGENSRQRKAGESELKELHPSGIVVVVILSALLASANAYLGLYAGALSLPASTFPMLLILLRSPSLYISCPYIFLSKISSSILLKVVADYHQSGLHRRSRTFPLLYH